MTTYLHQIGDALRSITTDLPALQRVTIGGTTTTSGSNDTQLPGGTTRMSLLADTTTVLNDLCRLVIDHRHLTGTTISPGPTGAAAFLQLHADWLATYPTAPHIADRLRDLATAIHSLVAPSGIRRIPVAACPRDCAGAIYAAFDGDTYPDLACDVRPRDHRWTPSEYQWLAQLLGTDGPPRMTPTQMARWLSTRFRRTITEGMVTGWIRRADHRDGVHLDPDGTVDRVALTMLYLDRRARKATVA